MSRARELVRSIRDAFGAVPFPVHCGLRAAIAMDDWISDPKVLVEITTERDYKGDWWDVPRAELLDCMMALSYLDGAGVEFYLPAYMTAVVEFPLDFDIPRKKSSSWQVIFTMVPVEESEPDLGAHFKEQFSGITGARRVACRDFLAYIAEEAHYDSHAKELAGTALADPFWRNPSRHRTNDTGADR